MSAQVIKWKKSATGGYMGRDVAGTLWTIESGSHSSGERGYSLYRNGRERVGFYTTVKQAKNVAAREAMISPVKPNPAEKRTVDDLPFHYKKYYAVLENWGDGKYWHIYKPGEGDAATAVPTRDAVKRWVNTHIRAVKARKNPVNANSKIHQAKGLRAGFRATAGVAAAKQAGRVKHVSVRPMDDVQLTVGKVLAIEYAICDDKGRALPGQVFRHEFTGKSCPMLTTGHDGRQLYFVGGSYRFKTDGINDVK